MRERARVFIAACFYYSGLVKLAYWWVRRSGQRLIILNYHRATGGDLHRQMLYLRRHYRILHLEEALEELYTPHKEKQGDDPRMPLVMADRAQIFQVLENLIANGIQAVGGAGTVRVAGERNGDWCVLTVTDPSRLREQAVAGIGPGKAYGNGLLIISHALRRTGTAMAR